MLLSILLFTSVVGIWNVASIFLLAWGVYLALRWSAIAKDTPFGGFWFCFLLGFIGFFMPFMTGIAYILLEIFKKHIINKL